MSANEQPLPLAGDEDLREAYASTTSTFAAEPHPSEDEWERFAVARMSNDERERLAQHIARCGECARVFSAVSEVASGAPQIDRLAPTARPVRAFWPFGMAAAAAVALFLIAPWRAGDVTPGPAGSASIPQQSSPPLSHSGQLRSATTTEPVPVEPHGRLKARPNEFQFHAGPDARAHVIRLYDSKGTLLWTSTEVPGETCPWPREIDGKPGRYFWQVFAVPSWSRDTKDLVASPQVDFEIGG
jgi:hypothetical protein